MRRGTCDAPSGQCSGQVLSRQRRNQQRCVAYQNTVSVDNVSRLANTCRQIRNLCKEGVCKETEHSTIMTYLEKRVGRFRRNRRWCGEEMEEIIAELKEGMEERKDEGRSESNARMVEHAAVREGIMEGLLQPHGTLPNTKQDEIFRILCANPNGLNNQITGNHKLSKAINIKDELDADGLLYSKHHFNLKHKDNKNNFKQIFQWEVACQAVASHNVHHGVVRVQEGGTGMVAFGDTTGYISKVSKDPYGFERWCWILYSGSNGHRTRVIVAYNACKNKKKDSWTTYQQQRQYFIMEYQNLTCPNKLFCDHLLHQLAKWWAAGDRIILFMDPNKHTYNGPLGRALADTSGLALKEAVLQHTGKRTGAPFFRGSKPIDGLWVSKKIEIANVCVCSCPLVGGSCPLIRYQPQGEFTPPNTCNVIPPSDTPSASP
jgi:hypothetical protein